ncbi:hypothetical protein K504DRAFT_457804 [Pleomassaria siparia CBS 279.74]|uniref:F-box domain-containing protein n=1 Tax=Pleomassaria siparia CBS 279.74 TaxID=1314801 RepID=A0A6G1KS21_9PLEO|nr:hypothetical protein K504DRAFT_457804 [Pleomassaria siparia CBS 279.74]
MTSLTSTPRSRSRSSTGSSGSSDTTMLDAPLAPAQPRPASHTNPSTTNPALSKDPTFSLLLSLPRELRDRIYAFALTSNFPFWWPSPAGPKHNVALGLLPANRQVYNEAAPILYTSNKFLFTHPSDCNIFRVIASPYSSLITSVYFRVREKDLRLWITYLGSKTQERSLKSDLPKLKSLWIFLRCGSVGAPGMLGQLGGPAIVGLPHALAAQVHAAQNALVQQMGALHQQLLGQPGNALQQAILPPPPVPGAFPANDPANIQQVPPPPPPAPPFQAFAQGQNSLLNPHLLAHPAPPLPHVHGVQNNPPNPSPIAQHTFYASFLRWERGMGIENLCLSLQETRPADVDVKIVCIMRLPKPDVLRLVRQFPDELAVDRNSDARTPFRKLHGVEVSLEISGFDVPT